MQDLSDIFSIWNSISDMADAINEKSDTVLRWKYRGRIPEDAWPKLIEAASAKRRRITAQQLLDANAPMLRRGARPKRVGA